MNARSARSDGQRLQAVSLLGELVSLPLQRLRALMPDSDEEPPSAGWPGRLLALLGRAVGHWSPERMLQAVLWIAVWLPVWGLTFPLLHWPFAGRQRAEAATAVYALGATALPLCIGLLTRTRGDTVWEQRGMSARWELRLFTYLGAMVGFQVGYMTIFSGALLGHYLGFGSLPRWAEALAAAWPVILGYAAARQVPHNLWRAFGPLRCTEGDVAMLSVFALFGPLWGGFFLASYPWLLSVPAGLTLVLLALGALAGLTVWQRRAGTTAIPAHIWALIFGAALVIQQAATAGGAYGSTVLAGLTVTVAVLLARDRISMTLAGGLGLLIAAGGLWWSLQVHVWLGRALGAAAVLAWWCWGQKFVWFPLSFWFVAIAAAAGGWLIRLWAWPEAWASAAFGLAAATVLWWEGRRPQRKQYKRL